MASATPHIILTSVNGAQREPLSDLAANGAITPGDLIERGSNGKLAAIATAGKPNQGIVALENPFGADDTTPAIDQAYAADDVVFYTYLQPGDQAYMRLAASQTVAIGDPLVPSATAGCLAKATLDATSVEGALVGFADEAVTTTGSVGRIRVRKA